MIISIDAVKLLQNSTSFQNKALMKLEIEGMCFNIIKAIYDKPIYNTILNKEKLKPFPLKSGMIQRRPLLFKIE
jgi:hypothetical protein